MSASAAFLDAAFDSQGSLFAAVYQGLGAPRLRVVPTSPANAALAQEWELDAKLRVSALAWAGLGPDKAAPAKKRKKGAAAPGPDGTEAVALGTSQGTVVIYSPGSASVLTTLKTGSAAPVAALVARPGQLFVLQRDSTLTEFDLARMTLTVSSVVPVAEPRALAQCVDRGVTVVANTAPHELKNGEVDVQLNGFATAVAQLLPLGPTTYAALSAEDRQVFVYEQGQPRPVRALVCPATNAVSMSVSDDGRAVAVASEDGLVHVFDVGSEAAPASLGRSKGRAARAVPQVAPAFSVTVRQAPRGLPLPVVRTRFDGPMLVVAWPEQGSVPVFDAVAWTAGDASAVARADIVLDKAPAAPEAHDGLVGGVDPASAPAFDESGARVVSGADMADLSDDSDEETLAERLESLEVELDKQTGPAHRSAKASGPRDQAGENGQAKAADPAGPAPATGSEASSRLRRKDLQLKLSQPGSFATLLNQALTLNDKQLLEICLEERDAAMIKTSIVKLEPVLAAALLEHLAATTARSHQRSAALAQWIRWTVVIHGAYLVTLPNLLRTLAGLHSTLSTRAATLPRLLALQGRLELLEEQLAVRSEYAAAQAAADDDADQPEVYYDEEEAMIVNGEEANDDDDDDNDEDEDIDEDAGAGDDSAGASDGDLDADEILLSE